MQVFGRKPTVEEEQAIALHSIADSLKAILRILDKKK